MSWSQDETGIWRRSDGVRILRDAGPTRTQFIVSTSTGTRLTQTHNRSSSSAARRFTSESAAMRAADKEWPVKKQSAV